MIELLNLSNSVFQRNCGPKPFSTFPGIAPAATHRQCRLTTVHRIAYPVIVVRVFRVDQDNNDPFGNVMLLGRSPEQHSVPICRR